MSNQILLCAIAKNESPYLVEWIAYHKYIVGFDQILIYENDSSDSSLVLLEKLQEQGICKYKEWPRVLGKPPQQSAYNHAIKTHRKQYQWICFLDLDEFLVLKKFSSIHDLVTSFQDKADSISINWRIFGYSSQENYIPEPVIQRFRKCAENTLPVHKHMKSITKIGAIQKVSVHVHLLKPHCKYFHIDGTELNYKLDPNTEHISAIGHINHQLGQINHYTSKSLEEYKCRQLKGRATVNEKSEQSRLKPGSFEHYNYDSNTQEDNEIISISSKLDQYIDSIYQSIGGKDIWTDRFKKFIQSEVKRYDTLKSSNNINTKSTSKVDIPKISIANTPLWAPEAVGKISEFLASRDSTNILEFGSGGSTLWLSNYKVNLTSIEHDSEWFDALKNKLDERKITNVSLLLRKLPYDSVVDEFPDNYFDLVLVDGRNRNDCIKASIKKIKNGGWLMLDDAQRTRYREGRNFLEALPCVRYHHPHRYTQIWFIRHEIDYLNLAVTKSF